MLRINIEPDNLYSYTDSDNRDWAYEKFWKNNDVMTESNWSRLNKHLKDNCFMISACRGDKTEKENKQRTEQLAKDIRAKGLGFIRILGGYVENKGEADEREVVEESFLVPMPKNYAKYMFFDDAIELCKKYNQDSVLISMPEYVDFGYYDKNGNFDFSPGESLTFSNDKVGEYFSALRKGSKRNAKWAFTTEWLAIRHPSSVPQSVLMKQSGEIF